MNRTSFVGALVAAALGAVLAFAVQSTPKDLNLHVTGLIILIAGLADLVIRFMVADSPLLSTRTAAVAAVVEPLGEPVLDVFGNPIATVAATPVVDRYVPETYAPDSYAPDTYAPDQYAPDQYALSPDVTEAAAAFQMPVVEDPIYPETPPLREVPAQDDTAPLLDLGPGDLSPDRIGLSEAESRDRAMAHARARDLALYQQAVAAASDGEVPDSTVPPTTLAGRPIRPRRRRRNSP